MKLALCVAAFAAATFFFLLAALDVTLGDVNLLEAGLTSMAAGLLIYVWPVGWPTYPPQQ